MFVLGEVVRTEGSQLARPAHFPECVIEPRVLCGTFDGTGDELLSAYRPLVWVPHLYWGGFPTSKNIYAGFKCTEHSVKWYFDVKIDLLGQEWECLGIVELC